jgi:3-hydroxyacyl-CoA dehydrogenase/enoyl-CoA hydratase/3-hydroxybutyryl-CoA epimerase
MSEAIRYEKGQDAIVVLTIDMPGQSANTMNAVYREAMAPASRGWWRKRQHRRGDHHLGEENLLCRRRPQ